MAKNRCVVRHNFLSKCTQHFRGFCACVFSFLRIGTKCDSNTDHTKYQEKSKEQYVLMKKWAFKHLKKCRKNVLNEKMCRARRSNLQQIRIISSLFFHSFDLKVNAYQTTRYGWQNVNSFCHLIVVIDNGARAIEMPDHLKTTIFNK